MIRIDFLVDQIKGGQKTFESKVSTWFFSVNRSDANGLKQSIGDHKFRKVFYHKLFKKLSLRIDQLA